MFVQASLTVLALLHTSLATALPPSDGPIAERGPLDPNVELQQRAALAFPMPKFPALAVPDVAKGNNNCPSTSTGSQTNMCQSGTPYCCSGDGNGGQLCNNVSNSCSQTIICCNNANGYQICIGNINFNMPVTINVNVGKLGKA